MGRRRTAGRDIKIAQGQRRDAFFKQMRRRGGVQRMPTDGERAVEEQPTDELLETETVADEAVTDAAAEEETAEAATGEVTSPTAE
jgi:hypothetical protein